jgi:DNA (cytosine-5)-methyltransferase 1
MDFTHASLFAGIGGFDYAAELMNWQNIFHCEWNPFCQKVLAYHFPNSIPYHDITKTDFSIHRGTIDILTGGFPCQPYSIEGSQKGTADERHLWPEMLRAIREIQPAFVVGENVPGLVNWNGGLVFEQVQAELEAEGYEVTPFLLPAAGINAPHQRERVWFIAFHSGRKLNGRYNSGTGSGVRLEVEWFKLDTTRRIESTNDPESPGNYVTNTTGIRSHRNDRKRKISLQRGDWWKAFHQSNGNGSEGIASDTNKFIGRPESQIGMREKGARSKSEGKDKNLNGNSISTRRKKQHVPGFAAKPGIGDRERYADAGNWNEFPTQSPVCNGDDGISPRLDGITFPKWRNESIKAGGNAIVPQVALQIFKAIEKFIIFTPSP